MHPVKRGPPSPLNPPLASSAIRFLFVSQPSEKQQVYRTWRQFVTLQNDVCVNVTTALSINSRASRNGRLAAVISVLQTVC